MVPGFPPFERAHWGSAPPPDWDLTSLRAVFDAASADKARRMAETALPTEGSYEIAEPESLSRAEMTECGSCGHPGVHAQVLPPRGAAQGHCPGCPRCQQELAEESREGLP
jgi:hypothetical protein